MIKTLVLLQRTIGLVAIFLMVALLPVFMGRTTASEEIDEVVAGNNEFAFDLYHELSGTGEDENLVFSPYGISMVLGVAYSGARGLTRDEIANAMHFTLPQELLLPAYQSLDTGFSNGECIEIHAANSLWVEQDCAFLQHFLNLLNVFYPGGMSLAEFTENPEEARTMINDWAFYQTREKIAEIIPQGDIDDSARLVPVSAVYFNGNWQVRFDPDDTVEMPFRLLDGGQVMVPMMNTNGVFKYRRGMDYSSIEIPYADGHLSMVIIMPNAGVFGQVEDSLDCLVANEIIGRMLETEVDLLLPRFTIDSWLSLKDPLGSLGIVDAFCDECAGFSGIATTEEIFINDIFHEVYLEVDEDSAGAAGEGSGGAGGPVTLRIDRPFIFFVRDRETGVILFIGRMMDPSSA